MVLQPKIRFRHCGEGGVEAKTCRECKPCNGGVLASGAAASSGGVRGGSGEVLFQSEAALVLPRDALVCLRLPYLYGLSPTRALLTRAATPDASLASEAVLAANWIAIEPNWLNGGSNYEAGDEGAMIDANDWEALGGAGWQMPPPEPEEPEDGRAEDG